MELIVKTNQDSRIELTKNDFLTSGGEGQIYCKGKTIFKIYIDPKAMIPFSKIQELSCIKNPNVVKPELVVFNKKDIPIGYTMKSVQNTYSLCQVFPKSFKDRNGITPDIMFELIKKMQDTISDIHSHNILIVDLNELNFLVNKQFDEVYFIDVDSYQTPSFPATAIMDSIRDRHNKTFSTLTDWFSFGIVSFQMFIGIHPYKGKHPTLKGLDERMMANIPVFHKDVSLPPSCLPFDTIPSSYRDWYKAIFLYGKRVAPPTKYDKIQIHDQKEDFILADSDFDIKQIFDYDYNIIEYLYLMGNDVCTTKDKIYVNTGKFSVNRNNNFHVLFSQSSNKIKFVTIEDSNLIVYDSFGQIIPNVNIKADSISSSNGRVIIKNLENIYEIDTIEMGQNSCVVSKPIANVLEKATTLFSGMAIQNILGSFVLSIFPQKTSHYQIKCEELTGYRIINAKYEKNVAMIIANKNGKYDKFILKFDDKFSSYSLRKIENISYYDINFTVLDNGVVVHIDEDEKMEIFSSKKDANTIKIINSQKISCDMKLFNNGTNILFPKNNKLYMLKMKNKS